MAIMCRGIAHLCTEGIYAPKNNFHFIFNNKFSFLITSYYIGSSRIYEAIIDLLYDFVNDSNNKDTDIGRIHVLHWS